MWQGLPLRHWPADTRCHTERHDERGKQTERQRVWCKGRMTDRQTDWGSSYWQIMYETLIYCDVDCGQVMHPTSGCCVWIFQPVYASELKWSVGTSRWNLIRYHHATHKILILKFLIFHLFYTSIDLIKQNVVASTCRGFFTPPLKAWLRLHSIILVWYSRQSAPPCVLSETKREKFIFHVFIFHIFSWWCPPVLHLFDGVVPCLHRWTPYFATANHIMHKAVMSEFSHRQSRWSRWASVLQQPAYTTQVGLQLAIIFFIDFRLFV